MAKKAGSSAGAICSMVKRISGCSYLNGLSVVFDCWDVLFLGKVFITQCLILFSLFPGGHTAREFFLGQHVHICDMTMVMDTLNNFLVV